jgi:hypothetical protein
MMTRMTTNQRWQHLILLTSFIVLVITGFALKFPNSWFAELLGMSERAAQHDASRGGRDSDCGGHLSRLLSDSDAGKDGGWCGILRRGRRMRSTRWGRCAITWG